VPPNPSFSSDLSCYHTSSHAARTSTASTTRRGILYRETKALEMIRIVISLAFRFDPV
jgi:hypothetical protein